MRSSSIWVPLFIAGAGAAAITALVVVQRHTRSSAKSEEQPLSGPVSEGTTDDSSVEPLRAEARDPYQTLDFDPDPDTTRGLGEQTLPGTRERGEAYDAVSADDLGAEWLTRATESRPAYRAASPSGEFDELTTLDFLDEEPASLGELSPDSKGLVESEAVLADRKAKELAARLESPRPPPAVFDIAELLQDEDAPSEVGRRS